MSESASSPSTRTGRDGAGGVRRRVRQRQASTSPSRTDPAAASCIGIAVASTPSRPMIIPATIQPIVPSTRTRGNSRAGSFMLWNEIELVSASVGM